MSIADRIPWPKREQHHPTIEDDLAELAELEEIKRMKLPTDLRDRLDDALDDFGGKNRRQFTAKQLAEQIAHLEKELINARQLVADGEERKAKLELQLAQRLDAEIAELERLRPRTGETHATTADDSRLLTGPTRNVPDGGSAGVPNASAGPEGEPF